MQQGLGTSGMSISLPGPTETLGLQFSVFGNCSDITPTTNCTVTVTVMNGLTQVASTTAFNNPQNGTYEANFNLPSGTNMQGTGMVVVTCSTMTGNTTVAGLTIGSQGVLTITNPPATNPEAAAGFPSWSGLVARGQVRGCNGNGMWLRLTDAGNDIIGHQYWAINADDTPWECDIGKLVIEKGLSALKGRRFNVHVSVWKHPYDGQQVRVSSGFFSVGE